jgi:hypothetical protein
MYLSLDGEQGKNTYKTCRRDYDFEVCLEETELADVCGLDLSKPG